MLTSSSSEWLKLVLVDYNVQKTDNFVIWNCKGGSADIETYTKIFVLLMFFFLRSAFAVVRDSSTFYQIAFFCVAILYLLISAVSREAVNLTTKHGCISGASSARVDRADVELGSSEWRAASDG